MYAKQFLKELKRYIDDCLADNFKCVDNRPVFTSNGVDYGLSGEFAKNTIDVGGLTFPEGGDGEGAYSAGDTLYEGCIGIVGNLCKESASILYKQTSGSGVAIEYKVNDGDWTATNVTTDQASSYKVSDLKNADIVCFRFILPEGVDATQLVFEDVMLEHATTLITCCPISS